MQLCKRCIAGDENGRDWEYERRGFQVTYAIKRRSCRGEAVGNPVAMLGSVSCGQRYNTARKAERTLLEIDCMLLGGTVVWW